jgi:hypothetical protein
MKTIAKEISQRYVCIGCIEGCFNRLPYGRNWKFMTCFVCLEYRFSTDDIKESTKDEIKRMIQSGEKKSKPRQQTISG